MLADGLLYEIKTTEQKSNVFFMSINELKIAYQNPMFHRIMFIKIMNKKVFGYIIKNMFDTFSIKWSDVINDIGSNSVSITSKNCCFQMKDEFLMNFQEIDLSNIIETGFWCIKAE